MGGQAHDDAAYLGRRRSVLPVNPGGFTAPWRPCGAGTGATSASDLGLVALGGETDRGRVAHGHWDACWRRLRLATE